MKTDQLVRLDFPRASANGQRHSNGKAHEGEGRFQDPDLLGMNSLHAVVKVGGKTRVLSWEEDPAFPGCKVPSFSTIADFKAFYDKFKIVVLDTDAPKIGLRKIGLGKWWIGHEQRRQYDGLVYAPGGCPAGMLNLWRGFGVEPSDAGDCSLYLTHLTDNICSGNPDHAQYLLDWMAYAAQHPGRQGEVAVVMRGREGTGKGILAKFFGRLFGSHFVHISQPSHLIGHFNGHLQQCTILFADEAFFAGDRAHEGILKALVTEDTIMIERKGVDAFAVRNCLHVILASNNAWVVPAGADARRYFVLTVSDRRMQDTAYFGAICRQMEEGGGQAALLHHLLHRDLSSFNVRSVPRTSALDDQQAFSRRGLDLVIESMCHEGVLLAAHVTRPNVAVTAGEERDSGFYVAAKKLAPDLRRVPSVVIRRLLKSEWGCQEWRVSSERGLTFPSLTELRARFDSKHGPQDWPDDPMGKVRDWGDLSRVSCASRVSLRPHFAGIAIQRFMTRVTLTTASCPKCHGTKAHSVGAHDAHDTYDTFFDEVARFVGPPAMVSGNQL
jgi:Family of unknown function (DUF5906)